MATDERTRIKCAIEAMPFSARFLDLAMWIAVVQAEFRCGTHLTKPEAVALAKKLLSRALNAEFTKSEVEAFLGK